MPLSSPNLAVYGFAASELIIIVIILAMFAVFAGLAVWVVVAVVRRQRNDVPGTPRAAQKKCPDCAELVLAEARVCKHCGHRFDGEARSA